MQRDICTPQWLYQLPNPAGKREHDEYVAADVQGQTLHCVSYLNYEDKLFSVSFSRKNKTQYVAIFFFFLLWL